jgi:predicted esterase
MIVRHFMIGLLAVSTVLSAQNDFPKKDPVAGAPVLTAFSSVSSAGLSYLWWIPKGYQAKSPRDLTIICHGTGLDHKWGGWNMPPGTFRPDDICVSPDGPSPGQGGSRLFLGGDKDVDAVAAFIAEMKKKFAVRRVFLYGHSQGGFFVAHFAGERPDLIAGVVAHASGAWASTKIDSKTKGVAIVFMHGSSDPVVPFGQSVGATDYYREKGHPLARLRVLPGYNHWPNAVRATECVDWCDGMTTSDPERALACADSIATKKGVDNQGWEQCVDFAGAVDILRRFEKKAFPNTSAELSAKAARLLLEIEDFGKSLRAVFEKDVKKRTEITMEKGAWLRVAVAARRDFRGVESVESYFKAIEFDVVDQSHRKIALELLGEYDRFGAKDPAGIYRKFVTTVPKCCLFDEWPESLYADLEKWKGDAKKLKLTTKEIDAYSVVEKLEKLRVDGFKDYKSFYRKWR